MLIRLPSPIARASRALGAWVNVPVSGAVRRLDVILVMWGVVFTLFYAWSSWVAGLQFLALYLAIVALCIFLF